MENQSEEQLSSSSPKEESFTTNESVPKYSKTLKLVIGVMVIIVIGLFGWYYYLVTKQVNTSVQNTVSKSQPSKVDSKEVPSSSQTLLEQAPFKSTDINFQMNFPKGWEVKQESKFRVIAIAKDDDPDPATNLFVTKTSNDDDVYTYIKKIKDSFEKEDPNFSFLSKTALNLNADEESAYQLNFSTLDGADKVILSQIIIYYPDTVYIIQILTLESEWDNYYKNLFESSAKTFKLLTTTGSVDARLDQSAYVDKTNGYQVNLPKDWETEYVKGSFGSAPKNVKRYNGTPLPNFALIIQPVGGQSLDEILNFIIQNDPAHPTLATKQSVKINGYEGLSFETLGTDQNNKLRGKFLLVIKSNQVYLIGGLSLDSDWDTYGSLISASLATFKLF